MPTVAAYYCFLIELFGAMAQKPKIEYYRLYGGSQATSISGIMRQKKSRVQPCEGGCMLSRFAVAICVSMTGVEGKSRLLSGGTGFLVISGIAILCLRLYLALF